MPCRGPGRRHWGPEEAPSFRDRWRAVEGWIWGLPWWKVGRKPWRTGERTLGLKRGVSWRLGTCGAGSGLERWVGRVQADLGEGAPVHVGTAEVEVGLVHHPELGVQDAVGQLLHVHHADLGTCNRQEWRSRAGVDGPAQPSGP